MDFRKAMACVAKGKAVRVCPKNGERPHLVKVDFFEGLGDQLVLQCRCLTRDALRFEPGYNWEPVCFLLCCPDYLDGRWEFVDERDFKEVE